MDDFDKHSDIAKQAEAEIAELKRQAEEVRKQARDNGEYNDQFEEALKADLAEQIEVVRAQAYEKSHNG